MTVSWREVDDDVPSKGVTADVADKPYVGGGDRRWKVRKVVPEFGAEGRAEETTAAISCGVAANKNDGVKRRGYLRACGA